MTTPTTPKPHKTPHTRSRPAPTLKRLEKGAIRAANGFVNWVEWLQREPTDVVDRTPFDVVYQKDKLAVRHYRPIALDDDFQLGKDMLHVEAPRMPLPVLLIPPLMVRPFIFDLTSRRSLVRTLLKEGFDVYLVDFGVPDKADQAVRLEHYVLDWVPAAIDAVLAHAGTKSLDLYGYCMGGLFALLHTSVHQDPRVHAIVTIGSPIDAHKMGPLALLVQVGHAQIDQISRKLGNVPGPISSAAFRLTSPWKTVTRYHDLFLNIWNDEYVQGFDAVTAWTGNFIDYPGEAFRQIVGEFLVENRFRDGTWEFDGRVADLSVVTCPVLAFAGKSDKVVPPAAAKAILGVLGSQDKSFFVAPGGHMGVFAGRDAPRQVWGPSARWLAEHQLASNAPR